MTRKDGKMLNRKDPEDEGGDEDTEEVEFYRNGIIINISYQSPTQASEIEDFCDAHNVLGQVFQLDF